MILPFVPLAIWMLAFVQTTHVPPWLSFHSEVPVFAAVVLAMYLQTRDSKQPMELPRIWGWIALLMGSALAHLASGLVTYAGDVHVVMAYLLLVLLGFWWGQTWAGRPGKPEEIVVGLCWCFLAIGLLLVLQLLAQWLDVVEHMGGWVHERQRTSRMSANLAQPNQTATVLVMAGAAVQYLHAQRRIGWWLALVLALLIDWGVVLTQSRTALVSITLVTVLLVCWPLQQRRSVRLLALSWAAGLFVLMAAFRLSHDDVAQGHAVVQVMTAGVRPLMWQQLWLGLLERPWTGWGWLQLLPALQAGAESVPGTVPTLYAHNIVLDVLVMLGLPLGCLVLAWALFAVWRRRHRIVAQAPVGAMFCMGLPVVVHAQLEYPHMYAYFLLPMALMAGLAERWTRVDHGPSPVRRPTVAPSLVRGLVMLVGVYYVVIGVDYLRAAEHLAGQRLLGLNVGSLPTDERAPEMALLTQYAALLKFSATPARVGMPNEELALFQSVARQYNAPSVRYKAALAMALNGRKDEAYAWLRALKNMYPAQVYAELRADWQHLAARRYPQLQAMPPP